jgi:hypothetical protein
MRIILHQDDPLPLNPDIEGLLYEVEVEVEVNLRPTVSRPVRLGVRRLSGTRDQFFFLIEISFKQLRVCYFVVPSLTRGRVCNLLYNCFWTFPEQSHWVQVPQISRPYFTVSSETHPTWRARSPYLYPPGTGWPSYTPGHWVPFLSPLTTPSPTVEVFWPASTRAYAQNSLLFKPIVN